MEPTLQHLEGFAVSGITTRTINIDEMSPATAKLGTHWGKFFAENLAEKIPHKLPDTAVYGVYHHYESDHSGHFDLTAGVAVSAPAVAFDTVQIGKGDYLVFSEQGPLPQSVVVAWYAVWQYFEAHPEIKRTYVADFERYNGPASVDVFIGVSPSK